MEETEAILRAAQLLADPLRVKILQALEQGTLSVNDLTTRLGVAQPRLSSHLAILRDAGWVFVLIEGRQRRYGIARPEIDRAMKALANAAHTEVVSVPSSHMKQEDEQLRQARRCYDHLAGIAGVALCDQLLQKGWLVPLATGVGKYQPSFSLTPTGYEQLAARGVKLPAQEKLKRRFAYACPDWTESRPHIGGLLGVALLQHLQEIGLAHATEDSRVITLHGDLPQWLA